MLATVLASTRSTRPDTEEPEYIQWLRQLDRENLDKLEACCDALKDLEIQRSPISPSEHPHLPAPD